MMLVPANTTRPAERGLRLISLAAISNAAHPFPASGGVTVPADDPAGVLGHHPLKSAKRAMTPERKMEVIRELVEEWDDRSHSWMEPDRAQRVQQRFRDELADEAGSLARYRAAALVEAEIQVARWRAEARYAEERAGAWDDYMAGILTEEWPRFLMNSDVAESVLRRSRSQGRLEELARCRTAARVSAEAEATRWRARAAKAGEEAAAWDKRVGELVSDGVCA